MTATSGTMFHRTVTHLTPAQHDHSAFSGEYSFDLEAEQRRNGRKPLRPPSS